MTNSKELKIKLVTAVDTPFFRACWLDNRKRCHFHESSIITFHLKFRPLKSANNQYSKYIMTFFVGWNKYLCNFAVIFYFWDNSLINFYKNTKPRIRDLKIHNGKWRFFWQRNKKIQLNFQLKNFHLFMYKFRPLYFPQKNMFLVTKKS